MASFVGIKTCRVCMETQGTMHSIWDMCGDRRIVDLIEKNFEIQILHEERLPEYVCCPCLNVIEKNNKLRHVAQRSDKILHKKKGPTKSGPPTLPEEPQNPDPWIDNSSYHQIFALNRDQELSQQTVYYDHPDFTLNRSDFYDSMRHSGCGDHSLVFHQPEILLQENTEETGSNRSSAQVFQQSSHPEQFDWAESTIDPNEVTDSAIQEETNQKSEVDESEFNLGPSTSTNSIDLHRYQSMRSLRSMSTIIASSSSSSGDEGFKRIVHSDEPEGFREKPDIESDDDVAYLICFNCHASQYYRRY